MTNEVLHAKRQEQPVLQAKTNRTKEIWNWARFSITKQGLMPCFFVYIGSKILGGFRPQYSFIINLMIENIKMIKSINFWSQMASALRRVRKDWLQRFLHFWSHISQIKLILTAIRLPVAPRILQLLEPFYTFGAKSLTFKLILYKLTKFRQIKLYYYT